MERVRRERDSGIQVHHRPIIRASRPITYWVFTYDLIHYHSVIYICTTCRGFWGFAPQTVEMQEKNTTMYDSTMCNILPELCEEYTLR